MADQSSIQEFTTDNLQLAATVLAEQDYWRQAHQERPYFDEQYTFDEDYAPAYRLGYLCRNEFFDLDFRDAESQLRTRWTKLRGRSLLPWSHARQAAEDAWHRYEEPFRGEA